MSPALAPGIHLTVVPGVANFTFLTIELPITRVGFSAGVSLSGENLLETCREQKGKCSLDLDFQYEYRP